MALTSVGSGSPTWSANLNGCFEMLDCNAHAKYSPYRKWVGNLREQTAGKLFGKFEKIGKFFGFGWGALPPRPPPLNGRSSHLIEAAKRGRLDQIIFFSAPLTTRAPPGRPARRPAERPAGRPAQLELSTIRNEHN